VLRIGCHARRSAFLFPAAALLYSAADLEPPGDPPISWCAGMGRPATANPSKYSSFFSARYRAKLSG
jgi:hypothetical protein